MPVSKKLKGSQVYQRSQTDILGFGMELGDALNNYSHWSHSGDPELTEKAKTLIERHYRSWFLRCPNFHHICFADITFFSPDHVSLRDALTIVFIPENGNTEASYGNYIRVLREEYLDEGRGHTMAPHSVFAQGLPRLNHPEAGMIAPEIKADLSTFFSDIRRRQLDESLTNGFFWAKVDQAHASTGARAAINADSCLARAMNSTYEKSTFTDEFARRVSNAPISEQFARWVEIWTAEVEGHRQLSSHGLPPRHIIALPIGFRNPGDIQDYTLVACVFLAVDGSIGIDNAPGAIDPTVGDGNQEAAVVEIMRYLFLNILEGNASSWLLRKGELTGRDAHIVPAAHELSRLVDAIRPGLPNSAYHLLREYFEDILLSGSRSIGLASTEIETFPVMHIIKDTLALATRIQSLIYLAKDGRLLSPDLIEISIEDFSRAIFEQTKLDAELDLIEVKCLPEELDSFRHALLSAIRNAVRHSIEFEDRNFFFFIRRNQGQSFLVLRNSFASPFTLKSVVQGNPSGGTLKALANYTRSYGKDPRQVTLKRVEATESSGLERQYLAAWETTLPLPGNP